MTPTIIAPVPLVYNGKAISYRNDMLSLTDMWRAAGSPSGRAPSDWRDLPETIRFVEFVAEDFIAGNSGNDLFTIARGGKSPGTWAHWQVGFAYAKYLSPAFHTWCNEVVRERMEGRAAPTANLGAREVQLTFRAYQSIGKLIGFSINEAALAANRATVKTTGVNALEMMGVTHLLSATQEELLTPTIIGQRLNGLSAQSINKRLEALGYQESGRDSAGRHKTWHPTEKGKPFGQWFDTSKSHNDGASVLQWKWFATIMDEIRGGVPVLIESSDQPVAS